MMKRMITRAITRSDGKHCNAEYSQESSQSTSRYTCRKMRFPQRAVKSAFAVLGPSLMILVLTVPLASSFHVPTSSSPLRDAFGISRTTESSNAVQQHNTGPLRPPANFWRSRSSLLPSWDGTTATATAATRLFSLRPLIDDITETASNPTPGKPPRTVFVGGKGGVGKTTVSSSLAVTLASDAVADLNVLIVSTDPAHSLGDALDVDLRSSHGELVAMTDPLTGGRLHACEVDPSAALDSFRSNLEAFDVNRLADALGVSPDLLEGFGLREFSGLLNNPPPGLDELVALSNVLDVRGANAGKFDAVIVDTAPTGHTLRMLALPKFIDGFLGKLIQLRMKLSGLASTLQAMFGSSEAQQRAQTIDTAVQKLEEFKVQMTRLRERLSDADLTSFAVVTIPTKLGVAESKRLMRELDSQGVSVTDIVVNQCIGTMQGNDDNEALASYFERRKHGQERWIEELRKAADEVSASTEFKENGNTGPIALTEVPFFDVELVGVPALAYVGKQTFEENANFGHLVGNDGESKFIICGGKGGVGKTTTSSSLAVTMAAAGHNVAIVSTDPAHSLGDALDIELKGGELVDIPLIGVSPSEGSLCAMEIDPAASLSQFKGVVDKLVGGDSGPSGDLANTLRDIGEVFDTLPAGTDEVVALAKVVNLIRKGNFDRIVLDTAPTGHTLRMLSTPSFLADLIERVLAIAQKVNSNAAVKMLITSAAGGEVDTAAETAKSTLLNFQLQMWDLEDLFADADQTEFLIVTVPTELAVRESIRLLNDLTFEAPDMPIKVRNVVANQVLSGDVDVDNGFLRRAGEGEASSLAELRGAVETVTADPTITQVPYLDTEPRGVYGLKALSEELTKE